MVVVAVMMKGFRDINIWAFIFPADLIDYDDRGKGKGERVEEFEVKRGGKIGWNV